MSSGSWVTSSVIPMSTVEDRASLPWECCGDGDPIDQKRDLLASNGALTSEWQHVGGVRQLLGAKQTLAARDGIRALVASVKTE